MALEEAAALLARVVRAAAESAPCPQEELVVIAKNGGRRWWVSRVAAIPTGVGLERVLVSSAVDITDRRVAELELSADKALIERIFLTSPNALYVFDLDLRRPIFQNRHVATAIGYAATEIAALGEHLLPRLTHPEDFPRLREHIEAMRDAADQEVRSFEYRLRHRDGSWRWFRSQDTVFKRREDGAVSQILGTAADVTAQKAAALALEQSRARLDHAMRAADAAAWEWDVPSNRISTTSTLFPVVDFQRWLEQVVDTDRETVHAAFTRAIVERSELDVAYRVRLPDGRLRWVRDVGRLTLDEQGRAATVFGIRMDITRQRSLEEQAHQAQRLDAMGQLAAGIAHDLNNLLVPIELSLDLCERGASDTLRARLEPIRDASTRASALTRQILAFSRKQVLDLRRVELNEIVVAFVSMLQRLIGERIELVAELAPALPAVRADPTQVEQILLNLAINARDAMPEGGRLVIATRADLDHVVIQVTDTGVGMDGATRARIFEPFFTTKPLGEGTGLGLATVLGIVEQHGGSVEVESSLGAGTTFSIRLPQAEDGPMADDSTLVEPRTMFGSDRVLVVDDDPVIRSLIGEVVALHGYRVRVGDDAAAALSLAAEEPCDLLLADVMMPGLDGLELYARLKEVCPNARVLFMSGYSEQLVVQRGDFPLLAKPFTTRQLLTRIRQVLDSR